MNDETGEVLRDEGVQTVLAADVAAHRGHRAAIEAVIERLIDSGAEFDADDVQAALDDETKFRASPNLLPALFSIYRNAGRIVCVGYTTSSRTRRHAGVIRRWVAAWAFEEVAS